jgi:hypothetical protein
MQVVHFASVVSQTLHPGSVQFLHTPLTATCPSLQAPVQYPALRTYLVIQEVQVFTSVQVAQVAGHFSQIKPFLNLPAGQVVTHESWSTLRRGEVQPVQVNLFVEQSLQPLTAHGTQIPFSSLNPSLQY